jgi:hypothetical protein
VLKCLSPLCFPALLRNGVQHLARRQSARSDAGAKSSVRSTCSPNPPKSRQSASKSGFLKRVADSPRIVTFLVHADGAVHAVVEHHHDHRNIVLHGGCEFLAVHEERYDDAIGELPLCQHARRRSVARGTTSRPAASFAYEVQE